MCGTSDNPTTLVFCPYSSIHWHRQDPDFCDLDDLPEVLAAACTARDTYAESAAIATQLTKPKGGKKKKARLFAAQNTC